MGTQFFWFYDVILAAILCGTVYMCVCAGFVKKSAGLLGAIIAFAVATFASAPAAAAVYDNWVAPGVMEKVTYTASAAPGGATDASGSSAKAAFDTLRNVDMSKALIAGRTIEEIRNDAVIDEQGVLTLDLTNVDLSNTGILSGDLSFFGIEVLFYRVPATIGKVDISAADYAKYELEDIILAKMISNQIIEHPKSNHEVLLKNLEDTIPGFSKIMGSGMDSISLLILNIITNYSSDSLAEMVSDNLVKPAVMVPIRALFFALLYALTGVLIAFIARKAELVNSLPIVGRVNAVLGGVVGIGQAAIAIFLVCIIVKVIITLTGNSVIFLNTMTIDETFVFRHVYNLKFLSF